MKYLPDRIRLNPADDVEYVLCRFDKREIEEFYERIMGKMAEREAEQAQGVSGKVDRLVRWSSLNGAKRVLEILFPDLQVTEKQTKYD